MAVDFACLVLNDRLDPEGRRAFEQRVRQLEEWEFHSIAMPDSQSLWPEMYVQLSVAAMATERVVLWPAVTNPLTRHPAVAASAIASVDELSDGRTWFNLGSGDSAVYNLGLQGARLGVTRPYLRAVKELFETGESTWERRPIRLQWPRRRVPIYLTAEGPKTLQLAGELADGVLVGTGLQPELIRDALEHLAAGANRSGRSLEDLDVWWFVKWNMDDDADRAVHEMRMTLTASANHAFRFTLEGKHIPEEHHDGIRALQDAYVFSEHEAHGDDRRNANLVDELGLTAYLADRFTLHGPPEQFRERIAELQAVGATKLLMAFFGETDRDAKHERLATEVMPAFR